MKSSHSFTRRHFIKSAALAGAAPFILRSNLWAADTAPDKQITLGFIGQGKQGSFLMDGFLPRKDVRVLAVCDVDTTRRDLAKNKVEARYAEDMTAGTYKGCATYGNFEELLARKDIDGVVIATPNHWHALLVIAAAKAGKDVYCEKPMNFMVREGRAMVNAVQANNRILQVGSMQRSMTEFRTACELVRNGIIGTVSKADVAVGGPGIPCDLPEEAAEPGLDWDRWQGPAQTRPYNSILSPRGFPKGWPAWRRYMEYGGGNVYDWGAHHFDIVQWAFDFDRTGPIEIIPPQDPKATDGVKLRYANGLEVTHKARPDNGITFYGDKGKIIVNRGKFQLWIGDQVKADNIDDCPVITKELLPANAIRLYRSTNHLTNWLTCIRSRELPICDVETGNRTATICGLVDLAYYHNQDMKWDPTTEQFTGGTGDPKWLTRDYRAPWIVA
jgi:predicted dehydrogenase